MSQLCMYRVVVSCGSTNMCAYSLAIASIALSSVAVLHLFGVARDLQMTLSAQPH